MQSTCTQLLWSTMARPVLSGTCPVKPLYGLGHRAAAQFQGLGYRLRHLYVEQQYFFFRSSDSAFPWGTMLNFQWPVWDSDSENIKFNTPAPHSHLRPCNTNESHDTTWQSVTDCQKCLCCLININATDNSNLIRLLSRLNPNAQLQWMQYTDTRSPNCLRSLKTRAAAIRRRHRLRWLAWSASMRRTFSHTHYTSLPLSLLKTDVLPCLTQTRLEQKLKASVATSLHFIERSIIMRPSEPHIYIYIYIYIYSQTDAFAWSGFTTAFKAALNERNIELPI